MCTKGRDVKSIFLYYGHGIKLQINVEYHIIRHNYSYSVSVYNVTILQAPLKLVRVDTDECLQNPCGQVCINFYGGFECSCTEGYLLGPNRMLCNGKEKCVSPDIIIAYGMEFTSCTCKKYM